MRTSLLQAPRWVLSLISGSLFGLGMGAFSHVGDGDPWGTTVVTAVLSGVLFGYVMGWFLDRQNRQLRAAAGPALADRRVRRAARRGPAPEDADVRSGALRVVEQQLDQTRRQRRWVVPVFAVFSALYLWLALSESPGWWLAEAFFLAMLVLSVALPWWLERRRRVLAG